MIQATIYDNQGCVLGCYTSNDPDMLMMNLQHHNWIEGAVPADHYIKDGQAWPMGPRPDTEDLKHSWDYANCAWKLNVETTANNIRQRRNNMLSDLDRVNPVWFNSLTTQQQSELAEYRLALLAVPQQSGFPTQVNWPAKPTWI